MDPSSPPVGDRIKLNVGGRVFETTTATLRSAGPDTLLSALSSSPSSSPVFIDRDPDIFSHLLSLLRSGRLSSSALRHFSPHDLLDDALFYGIDPLLRQALSPPPLLGADASLSSTLLPASDPFISAISPPSPFDPSLWLAHAGQISAFDSTLYHSSSLRTHLDSISSLRRASPHLAAVGSADSPGLHFYDLSAARHAAAVHWSDPSDPRIYKARVVAISSPSSSGTNLFASFECAHRENCILEIDPHLAAAVSVIGRQSGGAAKSAVAGKVVHVAERGVVFAAAVSRGAFGYSGYMRLWDPRSGEAVWEACEPGGSGRFGDSFADADVDCETAAIYKVCWKSGDVAVADMRRLGEDPWRYLEEPGASLRMPVGGEDSVVLCYKGQVFVSREPGLEVWSPIDGEDEAGRMSSTGYRRDFVDTEEDARRGMITKMEGGGDRLFLCRDGVEGVEVWESSNLSGAIPLS